jgi:hypothetical protein
MRLTRRLSAVLLACAWWAAAADARQASVAERLRATGIPVETVEASPDAVVVTLRYRDTPPQRQGAKVDADVTATLSAVAPTAPKASTIVIAIWLEDTRVSTLAVPATDVLGWLERGGSGAGLLARARLRTHVSIEEALRPVVARKVPVTTGVSGGDIPGSVPWVVAVVPAAGLVLAVALWRRRRSRTEVPPAASRDQATDPGLGPVSAEEPAAFCTNCGSQLDAGSLYCGDCGARVE